MHALQGERLRRHELPDLGQHLVESAGRVMVGQVPANGRHRGRPPVERRLLLWPATPVAG